MPPATSILPGAYANTHSVSELRAATKLWYAADDSGVDDSAFSTEMEGWRQHIGEVFLAVLQRDARRALPDASSLRLVVVGDEPGVVLADTVVF